VSTTLLRSEAGLLTEIATGSSEGLDPISGEPGCVAASTSSTGNIQQSEHKGQLALPGSHDLELINQYIALQILEKLVQTRWKTLPVDQQQGKL
jgi:hypothetical protein